MVLMGVLALLAATDRAAAQACEPAWSEAFHLPGADRPVRAMLAFDDGTGPAVYVGGQFTALGGAAARNIARYDGRQWSALGSGVDDDFAAVYDLAVFDDGRGPALYACGGFASIGGERVNFIARWDGERWEALGVGLGGLAYAMAVYDDGRGPALYVGGRFTSAGGDTASNIARWDGSAWETLTGPEGQGVDGEVRDMLVFDDGDGPALFATGRFLRAGGRAANRIVRWDGADFQVPGNGLNGDGAALAVFDDGAGPALYAGGSFWRAGVIEAANVAKWDGRRWSPLAGPGGQGVGGGRDEPVLAVHAHDDGRGPALYVAGELTSAGGELARGVARWDGARWEALGSGLSGFGSYTRAEAMASFEVGTQRLLLVGGLFEEAGGERAASVAQWDGVEWGPAPGLERGGGLQREVWALAAVELTGGAKLYAGGEFEYAGGVAANHIAQWDGQAWSPLGEGTNATVQAIAGFDEGTGPALYATGGFDEAGGLEANAIARWDGASWSPLGDGLTRDRGQRGDGRALAVFDDGSGPALYVGGEFINAGGAAASNIARWDGDAWSPLGSGTSLGLNGVVHALAVYDDGAGPALYAGGGFTAAGGVQAFYLARWDGTAWTQVGGGMENRVRGLAVYDDGRGEALYAIGTFDTAGGQRGPGGGSGGGVPARSIARWDGTTWEPLGDGLSFSVARVLAVADDGRGPALFAGGGFSTAGGAAANGIARWDGTGWEGLAGPAGGVGVAGGPVAHVGALAAFDDGHGPALFAGGEFTSAGGLASANIARWGCVAPCRADLDADGRLTVFDFLAFINLYQSGDPIADFDGDGLLTAMDFLAFQSAFDAGCA
jgi:hypothetical protein